MSPSYNGIMAMENVAEIVREGFQKVKSCRSLCAITSIHIVISRSIIRTVSMGSSSMNSLLPSPITIL